jgi:hypothetical protein
MIVGTLCLQLALEGTFSLKDKRRILRSLIERARREYQVAAAEVDDQELWGNATVGVAYVTNSAVHAESVLQKVLDLFDHCPEVCVENVERDIERR